MNELLRWLNRNFKLLGAFAIFLCVATWALDLAELVHPCDDCRTQRTAIGMVGMVGMVGILMLFPRPREWWVRGRRPSSASLVRTFRCRSSS